MSMVHSTTTGPSFEEIVRKVTHRRQYQSPLIAQMVQVRDRYNGDVVIPMPNTSDELPLPPLMPAIIANTIDRNAIRAASVMPNLFFPAMDGARQTGRRSTTYANVRRRATAYTWRTSYWNLAARRAFRHLAGYATTNLVCSPDFKNERPVITVRDPLSTYPEPKAPEDFSPPADVAYVYRKSVEWIAARFPQTSPLMTAFSKAVNSAPPTWDIVEWIDADVQVIGLLGPSIPYRNIPQDPLSYTMELRRWPNRAGCCTMYAPHLVTMDRVASQVSNMVGLVDLMAKLVQLDIRATEKSIYPDKYVLAKQGQSPQLVGGSWKPGYTGDINLVMDADSIGTLRSDPSPNGSQVIDRLERAVNISTYVTPQQAGESYGALRTGRGIDTLMGAAVDPWVQELHEIMEYAMQHVNECVLATYKGYWGSKQYSVWSGWPSDQGQVDFTPDEHFETFENVVKYPIPGADVQTATVVLGQMFGMKAISLQTLRKKHPYIDDPDGEDRQRLVEQMDEVMEQSLFQRAAQGGIPPADQARIKQLLLEGHTFEDAMIQADKEAQERQAAQAPPPGEGQAAAPETQPGLANPGEGNQQQAPPDIQSPQGIDAFRQLVRNMRAPNVGVGVNGPGPQQP